MTLIPSLLAPAATAASTAGEDRPAAPIPQPRTADAFKKLLRLTGRFTYSGWSEWMHDQHRLYI